MDLKLKNNQSFSLGNSIANVIKTNCTTAFVKDCPNVSGMAILQQCTNLTRVRLDIGSVSASLGELLAFANLAGFNDNYEPQAKPRLAGTWTINNWYTSEQLTAAQAAFDGLTIVPDSNYQIDFNDLAVQTLDSTRPNYNPAVGIILQGQNKGTTLSNPVVSGGGRWFLSKTQAVAITSISTWFKQKVSVIDTNGIVSSDSTISYNFEHFDELQYFGITEISNAFYSCSNLESVILPSTISSLPGGNYIENAIFSNCSKLKSINLDNITSFGKYTFMNCSSLENVTLNNQVSTIPDFCFKRCTKIKLNFPTSLTIIHQEAFAWCSNLEGTSLPNTVTWIWGAAFRNCKKLALSALPNSLTGIVASNRYVEGGAFDGAELVSFSEIPSGVTTIYGIPFNGCSSIPYLHILSDSVITVDAMGGYGIYAGNSFKYYVGDGSSAAHDDAILANYLADTTINGWASQPTRLDTWYNYLHPQS